MQQVLFLRIEGVIDAEGLDAAGAHVAGGVDGVPAGARARIIKAPRFVFGERDQFFRASCGHARVDDQQSHLTRSSGVRSRAAGGPSGPFRPSRPQGDQIIGGVTVKLILLPKSLHVNKRRKKPIGNGTVK